MSKIIGTFRAAGCYLFIQTIAPDWKKKRLLATSYHSDQLNSQMKLATCFIFI